MIPSWKTSEGPHELAIMFQGFYPGCYPVTRCGSVMGFITILSLSCVGLMLNNIMSKVYICSSNMSCLNRYVIHDTACHHSYTNLESHIFIIPIFSDDTFIYLLIIFIYSLVDVGGLPEIRYTDSGSGVKELIPQYRFLNSILYRPISTQRIFN